MHLIKEMPFLRLIKENAPYSLFKFLSIHVEQVIDVNNCLIVEKIQVVPLDDILIEKLNELKLAFNFDVTDVEIVLFIAKFKDETINNFKEIVSQLLSEN